MNIEQQWFNVTSVHRDDLIQAGFDGNAVDDGTMERLASKMCDGYVEHLFWIQIEVFAKELGIPLIEKRNSVE